MGCIYVARCKVNRKPYVGKTMYTMEGRRKEHERDASNGSILLFHRALRKYGFHNFEWKVLMGSDDLEDLRDSEIVMIKQLKSRSPNGYNMTDGGDGGDTFSGKHHSPEARAKISESNKGRVASNRGIPHTEETKVKIREATKGRVAWNKGIPNLALKGKTPPCSFRGRKHTKETKELLRENHLGKKHTKETKAKISKSKTGVPCKRKEKTPVMNEVDFCLTMGG